MAGLKRRYGSQRGIGSKSVNPKTATRGYLPKLSKLSRGVNLRGMPTVKGMYGLKSPLSGLNIGLHIHPRLKFLIFDRGVIKRNWNAINRTPLQRAANLIRIIARGSIKRRSNRYGKPSPAGTPPYSRQPGKTPPFKMIFNTPDLSGTRQFIGMVGFFKNRFSELPPPGLHELGGGAVRDIHSINRTARPGRGKQWTWKGKVMSSNRRRGKQPRGSGGQFLPYQTPYIIRKRVRYPKRPFMRPALFKAASKIPSFWKYSVNRSTVHSSPL